MLFRFCDVNFYLHHLRVCDFSMNEISHCFKQFIVAVAISCLKSLKISVKIMNINVLFNCIITLMLITLFYRINNVL